MYAKDLRHIKRIYGYCTDISALIKGLDYKAFTKDIKSNRACALTLEQIGENARKLSPEFKSVFRHIPWREMSDLRDVIAREYDVLLWDLIWEILTKNIPELTEQLKFIITEAGDDEYSD